MGVVTSDLSYLGDFEVEIDNFLSKDNKWRIKRINFCERSLSPEELNCGVEKVIQMATKIKESLEKLWEKEYGGHVK